MDEVLIRLYGKDLEAKEFKLDTYVALFTGGYGILESFHENRFCRISEIPEGMESHLISARLFCKDKNLRIRRLSDDVFRIASDFAFDGSVQVWEKKLLARKTHVILWGKVCEDDDMEGFFYEERIPYLFSYPAKDPARGKGGRMRLAVNEYMDETGRVLWSRFLEIDKWEGAGGKEEKEKAA